ncbi:caspase family protein [Algivirga pacifica]|uniref:Peptidase C14 caspase domain-containing protein n=1 Tax=Algivirga pacifica TaxID=1162670 RepID=A0ABP9D885_9BACT
MKTSLFLLTLLLFLLSPPHFIQAKGKKALLIGINEYRTPGTSGEWRNLEGAINDVEAIYSILTSKYGFQDNHIQKLITPKTTTKQALKAALKQLSEQTEQDDIIFIYYAGHGAQVRNSLFFESDQKHETIVPSDGNKGVNYYLLDTELNAYLHQIMDKGGRLTVIFDSCNSGSVSRSTLTHADFSPRVAPTYSVDLKMPFSKTRSLAERGALVISAAQDYEQAGEVFDPTTQQTRGAFTFALSYALLSSNNRESVLNLFKRVASILEYQTGPLQNPVLEANTDRLQKPLLDFGDAVKEYGIMVSVLKGDDPNHIILGGGYSIGLQPGSEISYIRPNGVSSKLIVTSDIGLVQAKAKVVHGPTVPTGTLLPVNSWNAQGNNILNLYLPPSSFSGQDLRSLFLTFSEAAKSGVKLDYDTRLSSPEILLNFNGNHWELSGQLGRHATLRKSFTAQELLQAMGSVGSLQQTLSVNIPYPKDLYDDLMTAFKEKANIRIVNTPSAAHYQVYGGVDYSGPQSLLAYTWTNIKYKGEGVLTRSALPLHSDWHVLNTEGNLATQMIEDAAKISNIISWLGLASPPDQDHFPYRLSLQNMATNEMLEKGNIYEGYSYRLVLHQDATLYPYWNKSNRFLYIFSISNQGDFHLIFPEISSTENTINRIGLDPATGRYKSIIDLNTPIQVHPPFGTDHLILLTSNRPITDLSVFNQRGFGSYRNIIENKWSIQQASFTSSSEQ